MKESVTKSYEIAREAYAAFGVDTASAIKALDEIIISLHCWQGDDVTGFEQSGEALSGGIQATGSYPGKARTPDELRSDMKKAFSLIPGKGKANIHAFYLEAGGKKVDRDAIEPSHFDAWADWARSLNIGLDFNPTFFSHPKSADGYTLSHADAGIRAFWIEHLKRSREISEYLGKKTGVTSYNNIWIPDGAKDNPADRLAPRERLAAALDEGLAPPHDPKFTADSVESKLFGIGSEAYVVGSHEFYMGYALKNNMMLTLDTGHFHPTETVSNKISALMLFLPELLLHVSRPIRWDSDHVVALDDELLAIMQEIVRGGFLSRAHLALDYFDASINRVAAWVIGTRNTKKALLRALLEPSAILKKAELEGDGTTVLALTEEQKSMPWNAVWDYYCESAGVPSGADWLAEVKAYEKSVLAKR